ncbi:MAG TPA: CHASE4 domain-containing protein, partial [Coriobacteriia bacterium]
MRARMLLVVGLTMAALLVLVFLGASALLLRQFEGLETRAAAVDASRVRSSLDEDVAQLERVARDLAPRDSTNDFMKGARPDPPSALRTVEGAVGLGANVIVLVDESERVQFEQYVDLDLGTVAKRDEQALAAILGARVLRHAGDPRGHSSGLIRVGDRVMLVAARSVTTSDMYTPPSGTLIVARYVDDTEVEGLVAGSKLAVFAFSLGATDVPEDVRRAVEALKTPGSEWSAVLGDGSL